MCSIFWLLSELWLKIRLLAVPRQLYRQPCHSLSTRHYHKLKCILRDLRPLRHVIGAMRRHAQPTKYKDKDIKRTPPKTDPRDL